MFVRGRRYYRARKYTLSIPEKASRILNIVLIGMLLIVIRVWHLAIIQHEQRLEEALKPSNRILIEPAKRASIRDRFNIPLAINKIHYQAGIFYSQLSDIPSISWITNVDGSKSKQYKRKEYIKQLSELLGNELELDPERIEDLIYAKAAFHPHIPFIIKEEINEQQYYHLKMLEKDWPGIYVQKAPKRYYPQGRVGADILGYMGAISRSEYDAILNEIKNLETFLKQTENEEDVPLPSGMDSIEAVTKRLKDLEDRAYSINDYVGKTGIEKQYEEDLRGFYGKKIYYSDAKGNFLREMAGSRSPLPGKRFLLSISAELQEYAELLLIQNEQMRIKKSSSDYPWIRGGAIVAMDPHTGEVLALASYPRYDPNDFIPKGNAEKDRERLSHILRWFEKESYVGEIWDQKRPLERELYNEKKGIFYEDSLMLTWDHYLDLLLPKAHVVREAIISLANIQSTVELHNAFQELLSLSGQEDARVLLNALYRTQGHVPFRHGVTVEQREIIENRLQEFPVQTAQYKQTLDKYLMNLNLNYDKLLLIDLSRLVVKSDLFSKELMQYVGEQSLATYHNASGAISTIEEVVRALVQELFHEHHFKPWRKANEKTLLKQKRAEEKMAKTHAKPYIEYLDQMEKNLFQEFWHKHRWSLITLFLKGKMGLQDPPDELNPYLNSLTTWHRELTLGAHAALSWRSQFDSLQQITQTLPSQIAFKYLQTMRSYNELDRALLGRYGHLRNSKKKSLEKHLAAAFYPVQGYGYGRSRAFRQATTQGSVFKLVVAYEALVQRYHSLLQKGESLRNLNPFEIVDRAEKQGDQWIVAYTIDGKPIPQMYKGGRLAKTIIKDVGRIDIVKALETSSNPYFSILAAEYCDDPFDIAKTARLFSYGSKTGIDLPGEFAGSIPNDLDENKTGLYSFAMGQHSLVVTPLQTAVMLSAIANGGKVLKPQIISRTVECTGNKPRIENTQAEIKREIFFPKEIRNLLLKGMKRVVNRIQEEGISSLSRTYNDYPQAIQDYLRIQPDLYGKSSSAESMEHLHFDLATGTQKINHIWFGSIAFQNDEPELAIAKDQWGNPEIVVVVYLRHAGYGKDAAPVAAQMVQKWREIKMKEEGKRKK